MVFREAAENGSTHPCQIQYKGALALESNDSSAPLSYLPLRPMITYFKARVVFAAAFWCSVVGSLSAQQLSDVRDLLGPGFGPSRTQTKSPLQLPHGTSASEFLRHWNAMAVDASGLDHTPLASGDTSRVFGEQLGPARASRAVAIMHIAMFDAVNAIDHKYQGFTNIAPVQGRRIDDRCHRSSCVRHLGCAFSFAAFDLRPNPRGGAGANARQPPETSGN